MSKKSFKLQIFIIFLLPAIAMVYFSFYFVNTKYDDLKKASSLMFTATMTISISELIHNLQIERGLSSGYLVTEDTENFRKKLFKQYNLTDITYKIFDTHIKNYSSKREGLQLIIYYKNKLKVKSALEKLHKLQILRENVLNKKIDFNEEVSYYSSINSNLIDIIYVLVSVFQNGRSNPADIYRLERIKEILGLERAYIYNYLLSDEKSKEQFEKIKELIITEQNYKNEFLNDTTLKNLTLYNEMVKAKTEESLKNLRYKLLRNELSKKDAKIWFEISSKKINELERLSIKISQIYFSEMKNIYNKSRNSLFITFILWMLSLISFFILIYILNKLINNEAKLLEDLRILSYTFDAHEAITITDPNGKILKVNKAFTRITGYDEKEVVGKNPRVLKSEKHTEEFYRKMWQDLHTLGYWSGEIYNKRKNGEIYMEKLSISAIKDKNDITTHYIAQFLDVSDLKKAQEEALHQATHDFLTKLPNRNSMVKKLHEEFLRARRHDFLNSFLFIDIDGFKYINDTFGHAIGDKLLISIAKRLRNTIRTEDYVSRISGDEFCVMILNLNNDEEKAANDTKIIASKILDTISKPYFINEYKLEITASIGIKIFPIESQNTSDVISKADTAMYKAKENGKNQFVFFDKSIEYKIKETTLLEYEIKDGLKHNQFTFYFQPKVFTDTKKIYGGEMLLRWEHPFKGVLYPKHFLHVMKNLKLLPEISKLAINEACSFLAENRGYFQGTLSINIDSSSLSSEDIVEYIKEKTLKYKIEFSHLELEILEEELIKDYDKIRDNIEKLRSLGIKFSIDNFGTGYSSLIYLQRVPFDTVKIDRYFIKHMNNKTDEKIMKMIIKISNSFNFITVVEGIENEEQLKFISKHNAKVFQGFLFSKAVDKKSFIALLKEYNKPK